MQTVSQQLILLEHIADRLRAITSRTDPERKKELVGARRALMDQLSRFQEVVESTDIADRSSEFTTEFGRRLAQLRTATARFQAEWPAVIIDDDPLRYAEAAKGAGQSLRDFIAWGHQAVGAS